MALETERFNRLKLTRHPSDLNTRTLSEMPLCHLWPYDHDTDTTAIETPTGFKIIQGSAFMISQEGPPPYPTSHRFATGPNDTILCFTPGQFVLPDDSILTSGQRIAMLNRSAPHLVKRYSDGIARLYGVRSEILQALGLKYLDIDMYPVIADRP